MNYLAHLFLSGDNEDLMFGNFIGDHVKGRSLSAYSTEVQKGILLHRAIDTFTDTHPATQEGKTLLYPFTHKYAPVAMDVILDHFLAVHWEEYHHQPLHAFTADAYEKLQKKVDVMPEKTQLMFFYMKRDNWLLHYSTLNGIERSLRGLASRSSNPFLLKQSTEALSVHYRLFENVFRRFFPSLLKYCNEEIKKMKDDLSNSP